MRTTPAASSGIRDSWRTNREERGEANGERDGCGSRAGGALPQEGQQEGRDSRRVPREIGGRRTPPVRLVIKSNETGGGAGSVLQSGETRDGESSAIKGEETRGGSATFLAHPLTRMLRLSETAQDTPRPVVLRTWWIELTRVRGPRTGNLERLGAIASFAASNAPRRTNRESSFSGKGRNHRGRRTIPGRVGVVGGGGGSSRWATPSPPTNRRSLPRGEPRQNDPAATQRARLPAISRAITNPRPTRLTRVPRRSGRDEHQGARRTRRHVRHAARLDRHESLAVPRSRLPYTGEFDPPRSQPHWPRSVLLRIAQSHHPRQRMSRKHCRTASRPLALDLGARAVPGLLALDDQRDP